jgi:hypothetical protein
VIHENNNLNQINHKTITASVKGYDRENTILEFIFAAIVTGLVA